ncbi:shikimate dehydrogenase [Paraburkholderia fungorum]|uniref:shikimate dehydrogenase (NADP(+)) n=1 Tax=Paraburkholderia fungorum TaxID=134537 RepID=A0A1H1JKS9_9BURK|nr:saccharopine dehydrogenase NADP-binding domain-containing protein [Paraburkholderia fungorum]SDR50275.1 shikimate dehydrogenase [Paraburkholderia fungorum]
MTITGNTQVFMIVGDPVAQVRAPEIYNHLFQRHNVDAVLVPMKVPPASLAGFVRHTMAAGNVGGMWVTIPHKAAMQNLMDRCDPLAQIAGAVNAVRRGDDGAIEGALFDGLGFVNGLDYFGIPLAGRRVLVVGAGGGGQAVAAALAQRGVGHLAIYNRTAARAAELVARLAPVFGNIVSVAESADPAGYDLIVNCTSQGLKADDPLPVDVLRVDEGASVVDIIMTREPTPLLKACAQRGIAAHAGFEMLVQQIPEYLKFFGMTDLAQTLQNDLTEVRSLLYPK